MNVQHRIDLEDRKGFRPFGFDPTALESFLSAEEYETWLPREPKSEPEPEEPELDAYAQAVELIQGSIRSVKLGDAVYSKAFVSESAYTKSAPDFELRIQNSPFVHIFVAETPDITRDRLIESFRSTEVRSDGPAIADRIEALDDYADDEGVETNLESLQLLFKFLLENSSLQTPSIVITNRGNYRGQWKKARNKHFAIEFFPDSDVKYVCFRINPADPEKISRSSGMTTVDDVLPSVMEPTGSLEWIRE